MKLLCSDLDRTLLPNGVHEESPLARPILWQLIKSHSIMLAYISGRDLARVLDAITEFSLPDPEIIVADVGTSVYTKQHGSWVRSGYWESVIAEDWKGLDAGFLQSDLLNLANMQLQEADRQSDFKCSYYLPANVDRNEVSRIVGDHLHTNGIRASLVFSDDPQRQIGLLDILPARATKKDAMFHLRDTLALEDTEILYAGDSGNDISAICSSTCSVLVANADESTRCSVCRQSEAYGTQAFTYIASGNVDVAASEPLNGFYAAGIVEGLIHYRPEFRQLLRDREWVEMALSQLMPEFAGQGRRNNNV